MCVVPAGRPPARAGPPARTGPGPRPPRPGGGGIGLPLNDRGARCGGGGIGLPLGDKGASPGATGALGGPAVTDIDGATAGGCGDGDGAAGREAGLPTGAGDGASAVGRGGRPLPEEVTTRLAGAGDSGGLGAAPLSPFASAFRATAASPSTAAARTSLSATGTAPAVAAPSTVAETSGTTSTGFDSSPWGAVADGPPSGRSSDAFAAAVFFAAAFLAGLFSGSGWCSRIRPSRSALRRTRSACASSIDEEWLFAPIPSASESSRVSLLVSPSSRASSWMRIFAAKWFDNPSGQREDESATPTNR